jgi:hypothetical protein
MPTNTTNVNLPGDTGQADPQLTPQQRAAIYIGDAAAPTLDGTPGGDGNALFTRVLDEVMGCGQVLTMILNLDGINTIHDLLSLPQQCGSNGLSYVPPQGQTEQDQCTVPMGDIMKLLRQLLAFNITNLKYNGNQPINYANVTATMFNTFRAFHFDPSFDYHHPSAEHMRNPSGQLISHRAGHSLVDQFCKTQEGAKSDYPLFEKDEEYVRWVERVRTVAATHDTLEVLDPTYIPTTDEETRLFELKNIFMFSVFNHVVKTYAVTEIVRQFSSTMDAHAVWGALTY